MAETTTPRLGLIKPSKDIQTPLDIDRLNLNADLLDKALPVNVLPNTTPPASELYDGKIVREKTTGIVWMAELQTNGSYIKRFITYPYIYIASSSDRVVAASSTWQKFGWDSFAVPGATASYSGSVNATKNEMTSDFFWRAPFKGMFMMRYQDWFEYTNNTLQFFASVFSYNNVDDGANTQTLAQNNPNYTVRYTNSCVYTRLLQAGDIIGHKIYVSGTTNPKLYATVEITCVQRVE
jgi:hypothetical protein